MRRPARPRPHRALRVRAGLVGVLAAAVVALAAGLPEAAPAGAQRPAPPSEPTVAAGEGSTGAAVTAHAVGTHDEPAPGTHEDPHDTGRPPAPGPTALAQTDGEDPLRRHQWALDRLRAEQAWEVTDAAGQTIAIVDTGVDPTHPDLDVLPGFDVLEEGGDGRVDDSTIGHGTAVAGIAGALVSNGVGIAGLAPDVDLLPVRVLADRDGDEADIVVGVYAALGQGADVINLSVGTERASPQLEMAVRHARQRGAVVVASSGNTGDEVGGNPRVYPAAFDGVLGVGATTRDDERATYSNYGDWLSLVAPGGAPSPTVDTGILTTCPEGARGCPDAHGYAVRSGTSFAAPYVSATAALVRERHPRALPSQVAHRLTATAEDVGEPGVDPELGHGIVDPVAAVTELPELGCRTDTAEPVARLWDVGRVETAVAGGCTHWEATDEVVLATARDFPDALAGAALAAARDVPLLLTEPGFLRPHLEEALVALGVDDATILGGDAAVTPEVDAALGHLGVDSERLAGRDRYVTAALAAREARAGRTGGTVVVASGEGFADAVAAGALLGTGDDPAVVLTRRDALPAATADALADLAPDRIVVVGGEGVVSGDVTDDLAGFADEVEPLAGPDRYATSAQVALASRDALGDDAPLLAVSGAAFPDALTAGALAARLDAGIVLVPPESLPGDAPARDVATAGWARVEVVGGTAAVADPVADALGDALAR